MTISGSMLNALSGLAAASRGIEVVSANVANVSTPKRKRRSARTVSDWVPVGVRFAAMDADAPSSRADEEGSAVIDKDYPGSGRTLAYSPSAPKSLQRRGGIVCNRDLFPVREQALP